jgi:hypothetical protein
MHAISAGGNIADCIILYFRTCIADARSPKCGLVDIDRPQVYLTAVERRLTISASLTPISIDPDFGS